MRKRIISSYLLTIITMVIISGGNAMGETAGNTNSVRLTYQDLFRKMTDLTLLAVSPVPGEFSGARTSTDPASKYDPITGKYINWDANGDSSGRLYDEGDDWVVFDQDGPGVVWRIWAGSCGVGHIKIYIDNELNPSVDLPFKEFMERYASFIPNSPNLAPILSRGHLHLSPVPYTKHCKIVLCKDWGSYYQITYATYPKGTELPEFNNRIDSAMYFGMMETERTFQNRGEYPYPNEDKTRRHEYSSRIKPGETAEVFSDKNNGAITMLRWDLSNIAKSRRDNVMRGLKLNIYWDKRDEASVSTPLGDFFGSAPGYNAYRAYPMGMTADVCYSYFYMPYKSAKITITNESDYAVTPRFSVTSEPVSEQTADETLRFCAKWHDTGDWDGLDRKRFAAGGDRYPDWPVIRISGKGRFCGLAIHVDNTWSPDDFPEVKWWEGEQITDFPVIDNFHWWGEGDEKFFVDGEKFPSTFGTGTEDYIGYSLAAIPPFVVFDSAYACQSLIPMKDNKGLTSIVRFHVPDNIPFQKSFDGFLEKYLEDNWEHSSIKGTCKFAFTAYWYEQI
ncbi:MAG: glycoside hydrolase family 172 protein [Armatimonadota bacterium]